MEHTTVVYLYFLDPAASGPSCQIHFQRQRLPKLLVGVAKAHYAVSTGLLHWFYWIFLCFYLSSVWCKRNPFWVQTLQTHLGR